MFSINKTPLFFAIQAALLASSVGVVSEALSAQQLDKAKQKEGLEVIEVTARKRTENVKDVPVSVSAITTKNLEVLGSAGMDVRALSARVPSLLIESSFGRTFPRFYIRGLGNTDFDLLASQPVSLIHDDVVLENSLTKGFPMFDIQNVEVLRGPQGTLFGRNTPAGLIKVTSKKPTQDFDAQVSASFGTYGTTDTRVAVGGGLTDTLSGRISILNQTRKDWIDNVAPGFEQKDQVGGYREFAGRAQLLWQPSADFSALLNYHVRDASADARIFRANAITPGTNDLVPDFDQGTIAQDAAKDNRQTVDTKGAALNLSYNFGDYTLTAVTGYESAELFSRGDIDGGYGAVFLPTGGGPGVIKFPSESAGVLPDHTQLTQEIRLASNDLGAFDFQVGAFFFDEDLTINNLSFNTLGGGEQDRKAIQTLDSSAWAIFFSGDYEFSEKLNATVGIRYSDDDRKWTGELVQPADQAFTSNSAVDDQQVSWDVSAVYEVNDDTNVYGRIARGYRSPSIQGRNTLFGGLPTVASSETMISSEIGFKSVAPNNRARLNGAVYHYTVNDQQITAVGGDTNQTSLLNADKTVGYGFEMDGEYLATDNLLIASSLSYNHTEVQQANLGVPACGGNDRHCTVLDPIQTIDGTDFAIIDGNSLPNSPEWIANVSARWSKELGAGEVFVYTDWSYRSKINFLLYEAVEFTGDSLLEGGLRVGYEWHSDNGDYEIALFSRNITDREVATGAIDFNNLTVFTNSPRFVGIELKGSFY